MYSGDEFYGDEITSGQDRYFDTDTDPEVVAALRKYGLYIANRDEDGWYTKIRTSHGMVKVWVTDEE